MDISVIKAKTIPEAWFLVLKEILTNGREYVIEHGSYKGQKRKELDCTIIQIEYPSTRPLIPDIPPGLGIPAPVNEDYLADYLPYLICADKKPTEEYTYGYYLEKQIEEVIRMYKENGFNTNQAYMTVGEPNCIYMDDPPCLRGIDTKIIDNKLHFYIYFRCIDGKTNIITRVDNSIISTTVEELYRLFKENKKIEVISVDENFKPIWSKVLNMAKSIKRNVVNVELYSGGNLFLTEDHRIPVYDDNFIILKRVDQLKQGDKALEPKCLDRLYTYNNSYIDLLKVCENSSKLYIYDLSIDIFKELRYRGIKYKSSWRNHKHLPFNIASQTSLINIPDLKCKCQKQQNIPRMFKITKDMAYFMGVWLADGWYNAERNGLKVAIKETDSEKINRITNFIKHEFNYIPPMERREGCVVLSISILFLAELFKFCGFMHGSKIKVIPNLLFSFPPELLKELFEGWFSSDAGVSTSNKLIFGFSTILKFLNERFSVYSEKPRLTFFSKENKTVLSSDVQHIRLLEKNIINKRLEINENFIGRKIKKISKISFEKVVYDLTVDSPTHLFACGQVPILVHNSWSAWGGFPANIAAIQLLKEYMAAEISINDGEIIAMTKGIHLYDFEWELAKTRIQSRNPKAF